MGNLLHRELVKFAVASVTKNQNSWCSLAINTASHSMDDSAHEWLRNLKGLRDDFDRLADDLEAAAKQLRSPRIPPTEALAEEIMRVRSVSACLGEGLEALASSSDALADRLRPVSLDQMDIEFQKLQVVLGKQVFARAREVLGELLGLRHKDNRIHSEIASIVQVARATIDRLAGPPETTLMSLAEELVAWRHPLSAIIKLIKECQTLDEEMQAPLAEIVEREYGTRVMLAAVQSHLLLSSEAPIGKATVISASESTVPEASGVESSFTKLGAQTTVEEPSPQTLTPTDSLGHFQSRSPLSDIVTMPVAEETQSPILQEKKHDSSPIVELPRSEPIPEELTSFETFCVLNYVATDDHVRVAWWREKPDEFEARVNETLPHELKTGHFSRVWLLCRAVEDIGRIPRWRPQDVESLAALAAHPHSASAAADPSRLDHLKRYTSIQGCNELRLPLFLEAMFPSTAIPLDYEMIDRLVDAARFHDHDLQECVRKTLKLHVHGQSLIEQLKQRTDVIKKPPRDVVKELATKRREFREEITQLWSAAGGTIQQSHCREAWNHFIQKLEVLCNALYPPRQGPESWNVAEMERRIADIESMHRTIADKADVKRADRKHSDKAAAHIADLALGLNKLMQEWQAPPRQQSSQPDTLLLPTSEIDNLTSAVLERQRDPLESVCAAILRDILIADTRDSDSETPTCLHLVLPDFLACPDLLSVVPSVDCSGTDTLSPRADVHQVKDTVRAAAFILEVSSSPLNAGVDTLVRALRERGRFDILDRLYPLLVSSDKEATRRAAAERNQEAGRLVSELHQRWRHLCELASPTAASLGITYKKAVMICNDEFHHTGEPTLLREWLTRLCNHGDRQISITVDRLLQRARGIENEELLQVVLGQIDQQQYSDALFSLGETLPHDDRWRRETTWRTYAPQSYPNPLDILRRNQKSLDYADDLIDHWRKGYVGGSQHPCEAVRAC